ncbi:leucyl aminopeptidase [Aliiroseovarius subalbicans]|uniref:leucyl aminopeptidase n=1 Tax=Aliiroseovarius subalbicans TaxID=2925840 RepID=UPI001F5A2FCC|nr:leucyl aminopeptidase [Aliiroseovarius subalbicans]MCI2398165.1 leucyl aminopeptidase [Aliiroseovarius subalbicans]
MTQVTKPTFAELDIEILATAPGRIVVFLSAEGPLDKAARRVNRLTKGALERFRASEAFAKMKQGDTHDMAWPTGMACDAVQVMKLERRPSRDEARKAGAKIGKAGAGKAVLVLAGPIRHPEEIALGAVLRDYNFNAHRTGEAGEVKVGSLTLTVPKPDEMGEKLDNLVAVAEGVFMTRDLVNEPSNVLTTTEFAKRAKDLEALGMKVTVLEEPDLEKLGMRTLLSVGQGSESPSKVVVMEWNGGKKGDAPFALIGKGVVFDTGGISLKPAAGMEDMTMDMGGAGTVTGAMKTLALRKSKANVVGVIGIVENMPDGKASRPGDVVASMKGDTVEIINTDAEGRLVLCDIMWYAQETFKPVGMIDLATLTGAIIIGLGHENAGVFSNDDTLCKNFLKAAEAEGEGAWRMPLGAAYDQLLKSRVADMKNVGGRAAGSVTAAQFLQRFVQDGMPWIHLDIAGVASVATDTALAPKGATGWGVMALNRMIADLHEGA